MFGGALKTPPTKIREFFWVAFICLRLSYCEGFGVCV